MNRSVHSAAQSPWRYRPLRYILVGSFNTLVSFGCFSLLVSWGTALPLASLAGLIAGIAVGFLTQGSLVFGHLSLRSLARFLLAWATMYFVHLGIVYGLLRFGVPPIAGGAVALCVITCLSYFILRDLVFRPGPKA